MPVSARGNRLSPVEFRVLVCGLMGCSVEQTAAALDLATGTVHAHRRQIKRKRKIEEMTHEAEWLALERQVVAHGFEPG